MVWIKRYHNDPRDYLIKTHEIEIPEMTIDPTPPEYDPHKHYEVVLCEDVDEITGQKSYLYVEESKQKIISPKFATRQQAEYWFSKNYG